MTKTRPILLLVTTLALAIGCSTAPEPQPEPAEEPAESPEAEEPGVEELTPEPDEEAAPGDHEIEVSVEVYERTFSEIEETIAELNRVIQARDFRRWQENLTKKYVDTYSDPGMLRQVSETPILERNNIELNSLRDYFDWVVVPSRANARLDDLRFIQDDQVEAIMEVRGRQVILYQLTKVDDDWKVDVF
ncbi:MAG: hypothetical protein ACOCW6_02795 [Spirochaetota bacterium]